MGLVCKGAHYFHAPSQRVFSRRMEADAQLIVILAGTYEAIYEVGTTKKTMRTAAGDIVYWPPGKPRTEANDPTQPTRCISVYFEWPGAPTEPPYAVRDYHRVITHLGNELLAVKNVPAPQGPAHALSDAYLGAMMAEYVRLAQLAQDNIASRVVRYIEEHMSDPVRLTDIARHVGLEVHHFGRKYKALTGVTPMQEVRRRKAQHARGMLMSIASPTLRAIAPRVGIRSESQLSRLLSRYAGTTARELKKMLVLTRVPERAQARGRKKR